MNQKIINFQARILSLLPLGLKIKLNRARIFPEYFWYKIQKQGFARTKTIIEKYHNTYAGCRCVIIGNGPSINEMDLSVLEYEYTFGLNRIYLLFKEIGFETDFLVTINRFVIEQFFDDINQTSSQKFINWSYAKNKKIDDATALICPAPVQCPNGDITNGYYHFSGSVGNVALELACCMGFSEIILIGFDHSFKEKGIGGTAIVSKTSDTNHFSKDYFGKGVVWQLPDYEMIEHSFRMLKNMAENDQRIIVDATVNGNLNIFRKVSLEDYLKNSKYRTKKLKKRYQSSTNPRFSPHETSAAR